MKAVPAPVLLVQSYQADNPEEMARALGYKILRLADQPLLTGVCVLSEFRNANEILLYLPAISKLAVEKQSAQWPIEQWHIAHELYHALAAEQGENAWHSSEIAAEQWASDLLKLYEIVL